MVQRDMYVESHGLHSSIPSRIASLAHTILGHFREMVPMCRRRGVRGCSHSP
jgi:hypothetical protein